MMTKESNGVHSERLMVFVRVRPIEKSVEDVRAVTVVNSKTLAFMEPSDKSDLGDVSRSRISIHSTANRSSHGHHHRNQYHSHNHHGGGGSSGSSTFHFHQKYQPIEGKLYDFDGVFDESALQDDVYEKTAAPLVRSVLEGFCATVFAYGATGSGKTHTMVGTATNPGVMARAVADIFRLCDTGATEYGSKKAEVFMSYLEIYNEQIRDLLNPSQGVHLELREDREQVHVAGLSEVKATTTNEVLSLLQKGNKARTMEATAANTTSSRSHAVLMVTVRQVSMKTGDILDGKLYLIDLAGSERASQTKNSGVRLREGGHINRSLLALGNCITALASGTGERYINYRDSKLTRLLKAALGGPSKTAMIAHVSPSFLQRDETKNTLLYAQRARTISNRVRKFVYPGHHAETSMMIQELRNEVKRLQTKLRTSTSSTKDDADGIASPPLYNGNKAMGNGSFYQSDMDSYNAINQLNKREQTGDRPEVKALKSEITAMFDDEFRLRHDLLKLDGAMLQSALDCEILRLMVLDWENLKTGNNSDGEASSEESEMGNNGNTEIQSVMSELKEVRKEQDRLLQLRSETESKLILVREKIATMEEEAMNYLPELQREVLSLLCRLQQDQLSKVSIEIETELKRRGSLLLRCLRQKALGEAIIHRQRHFLNAISGPYTCKANPSSNAVDNNGLTGNAMPGLVTASRQRTDAFLPPLTTGSKNTNNNNTTSSSHSHSPSSSDRMSTTPPADQVVTKSGKGSAALTMTMPSASRRGSPAHFNQYSYYQQYFPPLNSASSASIPKTTKYSDFRKAHHSTMTNHESRDMISHNHASPQHHRRQLQRMKSSSEENLDERSTSPTTRYFLERAVGGGGGGDMYLTTGGGAGGGGHMRPNRKSTANISNSTTNVHYPLSY